MKSAAEATHVGFLDGASDLLDHVDYRLAETPEEKEEIYRLALPGLSARGRDPAVGRSQRVTDHYDDAPNAWIFGVYLRRRTLQFAPHQRR